MRIHWIGLGKIGLPMARHLHAAGHTLTAEDRQATRVELAQTAGLAVASGPQALSVAEAIFSSLPDDAALLAVAQHVARHAPAGTVYIDTSTVSPEASAEAAEGLQSAGVGYLRAAISGNSSMAEGAQLTVLASGPREVFEQMQPVLQCFAPTRFWLGDGEQARLMKLVVNLMVAQTSAMLAEGLTLGRKGGLAWDDMWRVLAASAVASPLLKAKAVPLSARDFGATFTVAQMVKDLDLIVSAAAALHVPVVQTAATLQLMHAAIAQGDATHDYAAIIQVVERASGLAAHVSGDQ